MAVVRTKIFSRLFVLLAVLFVGQFCFVATLQGAKKVTEGEVKTLLDSLPKKDSLSEREKKVILFYLNDWVGTQKKSEESLSLKVKNVLLPVLLEKERKHYDAPTKEEALKLTERATLLMLLLDELGVPKKKTEKKIKKEEGTEVELQDKIGKYEVITRIFEGAGAATKKKYNDRVEWANIKKGESKATLLEKQQAALAKKEEEAKKRAEALKQKEEEAKKTEREQAEALGEKEKELKEAKKETEEERKKREEAERKENEEREKREKAEQEKIKKAEEDQKRLEEEEAKRKEKEKELEEAKKKAEEDKKKQEEEEKKRKEDEEKRKREEDELKKKQEEERKRLEEENRKKLEDETRKREEEQQRHQEEIKKKEEEIKKKEEELRQKEEEKKKALEEAEARRLADLWAKDPLNIKIKQLTGGLETLKKKLMVLAEKMGEVKDELMEEP